MSDFFQTARAMSQSDNLVVFQLNDQRFALRLSAVQRVVRMVELTTLPKAPDIVIGVVNVHGRIVPVVNIRKRFRLPEREPRPEDCLIVAQTSRRTVALVVDSVSGVIQAPGEVVSPEAVVPGTEYLEGIIKLADGMILIHDLDKFLSLDEEKAISDRLSALRRHGSGLGNQG